jgi:hypothetical protein
LKVLTQGKEPKAGVAPVVVKTQEAVAFRPPSPPVEVKLSDDIVRSLIAQCSSGGSFTPVSVLNNKLICSQND